jgi:hypothetical protein
MQSKRNQNAWTAPDEGRHQRQSQVISGPHRRIRQTLGIRALERKERRVERLPLASSSSAVVAVPRVERPVGAVLGGRGARNGRGQRALC